MSNRNRPMSTHHAHIHDEIDDNFVMEMQRMFALAAQERAESADVNVGTSSTSVPPTSNSMQAVSGSLGLGSSRSATRAFAEQRDHHHDEEPQSKKQKRKPAGPRTSRACLACRRLKMRCDGAEDPPCKRCANQSLECTFERRSDYLLNPEDSAWQQRVDGQLAYLTSTLESIVEALERSGVKVNRGQQPTPPAFASPSPTAPKPAPPPPLPGSGPAAKLRRIRPPSKRTAVPQQLDTTNPDLSASPEMDHLVPSADLQGQSSSGQGISMHQTVSGQHHGDAAAHDLNTFSVNGSQNLEVGAEGQNLEDSLASFWG